MISLAEAVNENVEGGRFAYTDNANDCVCNRTSL